MITYKSNEGNIYTYLIEDDQYNGVHVLEATSQADAETKIGEWLGSLGLAKAKAERFKALNTAMSANFIDTGETGFEFPISRNDRQSLNEYGTLLQNAKDAGLITDDTQNAIFPLGTDGTDTVTLPAFKGLLLRYGMAILTRQQTQAVKKAQIEAATTIAEVDAITW